MIAKTTAPVINRPEAVLATGRCEIAKRLSNLPGVVTARTVLLEREALLGPDAAALLAEHGFVFPVLLRTPGFHGGKHFLKAETVEHLSEVVDALPGKELMVIEYLDARGADGDSRKYRVMMVNGELFPLHVAISRDWKIHFHSAEMTESLEHREEDAAFLEDMPGVLGHKAMAALRSIQRTLGLDYGGIDFGLNDWGEVLLFEANATMVVVRPDADGRWDYRRAAVERVYRAVEEMLRGKALAGRKRAARASEEMAARALREVVERRLQEKTPYSQRNGAGRS